METRASFRMEVALQRAALSFCLLQLSILAAEPPVSHVPNFGKVNDHLYRGAEPSLVGLQELGAMGIKVVVDLREASESTQFERQQVEKLHMKYMNVPFPPLSAPTQEEMERVFSLLFQNDSQPVFVHCRRGKDRTGTVIACYRIQHDRWNHEDAFREAKKYGISIAERGMRSYILHFSPLTVADLSNGGNQPTFSGIPGTPAQP